MSVQPDTAFDDALRELQASGGTDRAWATFWQEHFSGLLRQFEAYAIRRGLGGHIEHFRDEVTFVAWEKISSGTATSRAYLWGIAKNVVKQLHRTIHQERCEETYEALVMQLRDTAARLEDDARAELRAHVEVIIAELEASHRSPIKPDILRLILSDDPEIFLGTGRLNLAAVADKLGYARPTVSNAWKSICIDVAARYPQLASLLNEYRDVADAEIISVIARSETHDV